ncbi:MAG TPA: hypothetical protein VKN99_08155 [Polyangia bacterium]|nr:hypothetical protein [Polyangia bacterium]
MTQTELAEKWKTRWSDARARAKDRAAQIEKRARALEQRARDSLAQIDVPAELRGAWDKVLGQIKSALDVATREDIAKLSDRLEAVESQLKRLVAVQKKRAAAKRRP